MWVYVRQLQDTAFPVWETDVQPVEVSAVTGHSGDGTFDPLARQADTLRSHEKKKRAGHILSDLQIINCT